MATAATASTAGGETGLRLEVLSPKGVLLDEPVLEVIAPAHGGELGVLAGHEPYLALLVPGTLTYRPADGGPRRFIAVSGGFLEIGPQRVVLLARTAERADQIDVDRARRALAARQEEQQSLPSGDPNRVEVELALSRAKARLAAYELELKAQNG